MLPINVLDFLCRTSPITNTSATAIEMNHEKEGWLADVRIAGCGLLMGGADIIPGVSGGTVALILGIYRRLVTALSHFDGKLLTYVRQRNWREAAAHCDLRFLASLGLGIAVGIVSLAGIMHHLLTAPEARPLTLAAFFGLILASSVLVGRMVQRWSPAALTLAIAGAAVAFAITGLHGEAINATAGPPYAYLFLCGVIGICAMILPGISGAFILYLLGTYLYITGSIKALKGILHGAFSTEDLFVIAVFCMGCSVGLLTFSKLLRWLLARYESMTMALLCGFMIGSLRKIWPFQTDLTPDAEFKLKQFQNFVPEAMTGQVWLAIAIAVASAIAVFALDAISHGSRRVADLKENRASPDSA